MEFLGNNFNEKNESFYCEKCDFKCRYNSDWNRHKMTHKHSRKSQMELKENEWKDNSTNLTSVNY